ncbi:MAG TPA: ABC transporter permease [Gemmatimonadales bacterium]|nr:ABC transporter permease [Gemmatimonadales bacterium]
MSVFARLWARVEAIVRRNKVDRETAEELRFHLDMETAKLEGRGLTPVEARRRAQLALGGVGRTLDAVRDERGTNWLEHLPQDLRYAGRRLARSPGFTTVAILTLALGIGANTAIYSVVEGVLLRALPFADASRLVQVWETDRKSGTTREPASWPDYVDFVARARSLDGSAALMGSEVTLTPSDGPAVRISGMSVTREFFPLVGVTPLLGRLFGPEEDRPAGPRVVVLGEGLWRSGFGADPGIVGRTVRVNDQEYQVIGVVGHGADFGLDQIHARAAYHAPYSGTGEVGLWTPLQAAEADFPRSTHPFFMLGRLARGVSVADAQQELAQVAQELELSYPNSNAARGVHVERFQDVVFGPSRPMMLLLLGAVGLVLLVACVNVANLLLARGTARAREIAVRGTLGAGRGRIAQQCLVESVLLAVLGGVAGTGLAWLGLKLLLALAPADIPRVSEVGINGPVLLTTLLVSLGVGLVFGMVPTIQAFHVDLMGTIRGESTGVSSTPAGRRFRAGLVVTELALSVGLVVAAGLLIRSFWSVLQVNPGYEARGVVKAEFQLPATRYPEDYRIWPAWKEVHDFDRRLLEAVRAIPGVENAAIGNANPLDAGFTNSFTVPGREAEARDWPEISIRIVTPSYFPTLGVASISGRQLSDGDDAQAPMVAVINQAAARRFFEHQDPVGQQIRFWGATRQIVGVVGDERIHGLTLPAPAAVYLPTGQAPRSSVVFARVTGDPAAFVEPLRRAVLAADPGLAVYAAEPLTETVRESQGQRRFAVTVLSAFALVTFLLALVGVHGVISYTTSQRTRELGIRMALGATHRMIAGLVLHEGLRLALLGTGLGLLGAVAGTRLLSGMLYEVKPLDPLTYLAAGTLAVLLAVVAVWLPARRAARVAPSACLRAE